jgi:hypothetical protein
VYPPVFVFAPSDGAILGRLPNPLTGGASPLELLARGLGAPPELPLDASSSEPLPFFGGASVFSGAASAALSASDASEPSSSRSSSLIASSSS